MPVFRIHRMKETPRQQFRWAPHVSGIANVKPRDYEPADTIEAESEYAAWAILRNAETPLSIGDILETASGELRICKYVGFEAARWLIQEKPTPDQSVDPQSSPAPPPPPAVLEPAQA